MIEITIEQMTFMAEQHLLAGRYADAEGLARQVLAGVPDNDAALRTAGIAIARSGRPELAISFFSRVSEHTAASSQYLGASLHKMGRLIEAQRVLREAVKRSPASAELHFYLGVAEADLHHPAEATCAYQRAIELNDELAEAHANLGVLLKSSGLLSEAIAAYRRSIELEPGNAEVHCNLGTAISDEGKLDDAITCYHRAIAIDPDFANAHYNLGNAMRSQRRHEEAVQCYMRALRVKPDLVQAFSNMGLSFNDLGEHALALRAYDNAVALQPEWAEPRWNRALTHLLLGDFVRGWSEFDRRNELNPASSRTFPGPRWEGQPLPRKTILLNYEMGLGDAIHFVRYAPLVAERVSRVVLECQPELQELFQSVAGVDEVIVLEKDGVSPKYDVHCSLMRLPQLFASDERTMPRSVPYLWPTEARIERWRQKLGPRDGRRRVGLVWAGSPAHQNDRERSVRLEMLGPIACEGVEFFSLQRGVAAGECAEPPSGMKIRDYAGEFENMADTAGLIANLDLVIAVDTSTAHLAGAMGKPVWVLMAMVPDWRWMLEREDTPWYPTMRLFRQRVLNDWSEAIARIAIELRKG